MYRVEIHQEENMRILAFPSITKVAFEDSVNLALSMHFAPLSCKQLGQRINFWTNKV